MDELKLVEDYTVNMINIYDLCEIYHIGKIKAKEILNRHGIEIRKPGRQKKDTSHNVLNDPNIVKYEKCKGYHYIAVDKNDGTTYNDYMNNGGFLTSHIKKVYGVEAPNLHFRKQYYMETGNYWWEQWFDIIKVKDAEFKKCPYCDWKTKDISNKSGAFEVHLMKHHGLTPLEYLKEYPEDKDYFIIKNKTKLLQLETNKDEYVICQICGKKLKRIDGSHLKKHNITLEEYIIKYGNNTVCTTLHDTLSKQTSEMNANNCFKTFESKNEVEIREYINNVLNVKCDKNRSILKGKELDIYIPSHNLAIEFNGNLWHSEKFGKKDKDYHINKTNLCESNNVKLIQIFEDEYEYKKDIILKYISNILGCNKSIDLDIKCKEIDINEFKNFFERNSVFEFKESKTYIGAYNNGILYGVMSFNDNELVQYAYDLDNMVNNIEKELLDYYINNNNINELYYNLDRRWFIDDKLLEELKFELIETIEPTYGIFNPSIHRLKRFKIGEIIEDDNSDRIWNCGYFRYKLNKN
ncbi:MAG: MucR family transcriptional regulator [Bacilli bacterium]|nr:MucR family transcriptional regulator [Bacilli bacterium]